MTYTQYRIAKRNGDIIVQSRKVVIGNSRRMQPWWKFWNWDYSYDKEYGEWVDVEIPEVAIQTWWTDATENGVFCVNEGSAWHIKKKPAQSVG